MRNLKLTPITPALLVAAFSILLFVSLPGSAWADAGASAPTVSEAPLWKDPSRPIAARVQDLISRLSLQEKASQLQANPPAIPRLGLPAYSHRNECLHGIAGAGVATVFPQAIAMAATWDPALIHDEADAIATEGRAKHNDYAAKHEGDSGEHFGLNFYSPNINIFRDPRWGRGQETYGEDPFLTARCGVSFIEGLQGDDPKHLKAAACAKHYAVHSGPESSRHHFNAAPSARDLYDTYLPAFEACVREGHVASVMGAYSSLYGVPDCASPFLLTELLRQTWGFDGVVFSDGGAIGDIWAEHRYVSSPVEAAAAAVKAGCDVSSGGMAPLRHPSDPGHVNNGLKGGSAFSVLADGVAQGLISEQAVDQALARELTLRFRLGLFDPPAQARFGQIGLDQNDTSAHRALALRVAEESIVLLKNDGVLPLSSSTIKRVAVIGPNANSAPMQNGNYSGQPSATTTILDGLRQIAGPAIQITFAPGCPLALRHDKSNAPSAQMLAEALEAARHCDVIIFAGGLSADLEAEEKKVDFDGFDRGDRTRIELPSVQEDLLKSLAALGKPVVFVNCSGGAIAMPWEADQLSAIVQAWYPGEEGGRAVAEVLFGLVNPAGRLPVTFYRSTQDLEPFDDYSMSNRTYRYFNGRPLFAFGHGLGYTTFAYSSPHLAASTITPADTLSLSFHLQNTGKTDGDEVAQVYFRRTDAGPSAPKLALCGFTRVPLKPNQSKSVTIQIPAHSLRSWNDSLHQYAVPPGECELLIGPASDQIRLHLPFRVGAGR